MIRLSRSWPTVWRYRNLLRFGSRLVRVPDAETYIFRIDRGARFWDQFPTAGGRLVTADDIRFNVERQIAGTDATGAADGTFLNSTAYRKTASIDVVDAETIRLATDGPDATYLDAVHAGPFSWMTSPEAADAFGDRWRDESINIELSSGTGPFIPRSFDPSTQLVLVRNGSYWKSASDDDSLPYMERMEFNNLTDPTAVEGAYRARQIDIGGFPLSKLQVDGIQNDFPDHPVAAFVFSVSPRPSAQGVAL